MHGWRTAGERERLLRVVPPALTGLIDGTISTLAPIFATAYLAGSLVQVGLGGVVVVAVSVAVGHG